ncbi:MULTISPECIES: thiol reductant ABC exporter subunit CydD [Arthrobacter]|uniref:Thiol reductant ABC exporter subunit CydD n=2 Tax=Arthrobacter TaxID=1663 RepID=A0ABU9KH17_9MICC|nr:thiol reductant ABC exporter subunit CydD [Arthrobacter sp. YJM1]MDP5225841.1 thiol reductant ABC exporter subunit CydD [Arthrobacter sp. YJM1]
MAERKSPFPPAPRRSLYLLGLLGALNALGLVLMAQAIAAGLGGLASGHDAGSLLSLCLQGTLGALLRAGASWGQAVVARATVVEVKEGFRTRLLSALLDGRRPTDSAGRGADTLLVTRRLDELDKFYTEYLPALVNCATVPLLLGARILLADWISALIIVLTIPLVPLFMILIGRHTQESLGRAYRTLDVLSSHLVELVRGLPVLLGLGRTEGQRQALDAVGEKHRRESMTTLRTAFLSAFALELIATISVALVAVTIGVRLVHGQMGLDAGLLALILAPECYQSLRVLGSAYHASEDGKLALAEVGDALRSEPAGEVTLRHDHAAVAGRVRVEALTVAYPDRGVRLGPVGFDLRTGTVTALTGPSGCGKSTILAALTGTLDAPATVNGILHVAGDPTRDGEATRFAYAPQHPEFLRDTVEDEVRTWAGSMEAEETVRRALELADAVGLAGSRPAELSPGEQRRVALARAFAVALTEQAVLVLDEPTAHLDETRAGRIRRSIALLAQERPVLLVSHDPATLAIASEHVPVTASGAADSRETERVLESSHTADPAVARKAPVRTEEDPGDADTPERRGTGLLTGFRRRLTGSVVLGVLAQLFSVCLAALSGWLIVHASSQPPILYLMAAIVGVRFFGIGRSALRYTERLRMHDTVFRLTTGLRGRLWTALSTRALGIRRLMQGDAVLDTVVAQVDEYRDLLPRVMGPRWTAIGTSAVGIVATALVLPWATPVVVIVSVLGVLAAPALAVRADRHASRLNVSRRSALLQYVSRSLQSRKDLGGNGLAPLAVAEAEGLSAEAVGAARRSAWAEGLAQALAVLASALGAVVVVILAVAQGGGQGAAERAAVVALLLLSLVEPFLAGITAARLRPSLRALEEELEAVLAPDAPLASHGTRVQEPQAFPSWLRFTGLSAAWPDGDPVFTGLNGEARPGRSLAVTGESGSGKSTLLAVLMGFLPPGRGQVEIHGRIAWCPQESHVFDSTVRGNLSLALPVGGAADAGLWEALERTGLARAVRDMPRGLDTRIGPGGAFLSGGQRQRLAMARTLLAGATVLLLDEPTAHLDSEAADALMADLTASLQEETLLVVSHREADLVFLDDRLVLGEESPQGALAR